MSAIPVIPTDVVTLEQLDAWIDRNSPKSHGLADRLRLTVAIMDWATSYRARMTAQSAR